MDGQRFDDLARTLAAGTDRRRMLAGIAGAALALLGANGAGAERKKPKKAKKKSTGPTAGAAGSSTPPVFGQGQSAPKAK